MSLPLNFVRENELVEITMRTRDGVGLLRPTAALTMAVLGVLAHCLSVYQVRLHAFVFLSNHGHMLATVANALHSSSFIRDFKRNTASAIKRLTGWKKPVWTPGMRPIAVLDDGAAIQRVKYILANGVKEGLVAHPLDWPGPSGARALLEDMTIAAPPFKPRPRTRDEEVLAAWERTVREPQTVQLDPIRPWADLPGADRRANVRDLIASVITEARVDRCGRPALGLSEILALDPFAPIDLEETPPPDAHYTDPEAWLAYKEQRAAYEVAYREASAEQRRTPAPVCFPSGAFRPGTGFERR